MEVVQDFGLPFHYVAVSDLITLAALDFSLELCKFSRYWSVLLRRTRLTGLALVLGSGGVIYWISKTPKGGRWREFITSSFGKGQSQINRTFLHWLLKEELVENIGEDTLYTYSRYFGPSQYQTSFGYDADGESDSDDNLYQEKLSYGTQRQRRKYLMMKNKKKSHSKYYSKRSTSKTSRIIPGIPTRKRYIPDVYVNSSTDNSVIDPTIKHMQANSVRGIPDGESFSEDDSKTTVIAEEKDEHKCMQDFVQRTWEIRKLIDEISINSQDSDFSIDFSLNEILHKENISPLNNCYEDSDFGESTYMSVSRKNSLSTLNMTFELSQFAQGSINSDDFWNWKMNENIQRSTDLNEESIQNRTSSIEGSETAFSNLSSDDFWYWKTNENIKRLPESTEKSSQNKTSASVRTESAQGSISSDDFWNWKADDKCLRSNEFVEESLQNQTSAFDRSETVQGNMSSDDFWNWKTKENKLRLSEFTGDSTQNKTTAFEGSETKQDSMSLDYLLNRKINENIWRLTEITEESGQNQTSAFEGSETEMSQFETAVGMGDPWEWDHDGEELISENVLAIGYEEKEEASSNYSDICQRIPPCGRSSSVSFSCDELNL